MNIPRGGRFSDRPLVSTTPPEGSPFHFQSTRDVAVFFPLLPFFDTIFLAIGAWLIELENCLAKVPGAMGGCSGKSGKYNGRSCPIDEDEGA